MRRQRRERKNDLRKGVSKDQRITNKKRDEKGERGKEKG